MTRWIWAVLASIFLVTNAQGAEEVLLEGVSYELTGSGFQLKLDFDRPYPAKKASVELINHTVQINLPNGYFDSGKSLQKVKDKRIKSVFTYQAKRNLLRSRIIYRANHRAKDLDGRIKVESKGNSVFVTVSDSSVAAVAKAPSRELPTIPPIDLNGELEKALNQVVPEEMNDFESIQVSAADIIKQDMEFPSTLPKKKAIKPSPELISPSIVSEEEPVQGKNKANLAESEIPVLTAKKSEKAEGDSSSTYWRAGLSLAIVLIFAGALIFGAKHWTRNRLGVQSQTKIRMLTQHHLGPKKSLAIVQVAGESILIGVTDHSINLIKTLSLLDEEIPEETPSSFSGELNRVSPEVQEPEVQDRVNLQAKAEVTKSVEEEFSYGRIQSQVADRLKEMRSL